MLWMHNIMDQLKLVLQLKLSTLSLIPVHLTYGFLLTTVGLQHVSYTKPINQDHHQPIKKMVLHVLSNTDQEQLKELPQTIKFQLMD